MDIYMNKLPIAIIIFALGLYFVTQYSTVESFKAFDQSQVRCADVLIQEGAEFFLFNSKLTKIPGVNPLRFKNLEEYVEFTEWQRSQGIVCPILYLQQSFDAQNQEVYKARVSPTDLKGGLPNYTSTFAPGKASSVSGSAASASGNAVSGNAASASGNTASGNAASGNTALTINKEVLLIDAGRDDKPYNVNSYPAFDPQNQDIGTHTPLDKMFHEPTDKPSPNPMDTHWGGHALTESLIKSGYYDDNQVIKRY